jgi:hypothetical protein
LKGHVPPLIPSAGFPGASAMLGSLGKALDCQRRFLGLPYPLGNLLGFGKKLTAVNRINFPKLNVFFHNNSFPILISAFIVTNVSQGKSIIISEYNKEERGYYERFLKIYY